MMAANRRRWLVVGHEASNSGAPRALLEVLRLAREAAGPGWSCESVFYRGGDLLGEFADFGRVTRLAHPLASSRGLVARVLRRAGLLDIGVKRRFSRVAGAWAADGGGLVFSNTGTNGRWLGLLPKGAGRVVSYVHELGGNLANFTSAREWAATLRRTDRFLAVSSAVEEDLRELGVEDEKIRRLPNFLCAMPSAGGAINAVRAELGLPEGRRLVVGCGHIAPLKGVDRFVDVAALLARCMADAPEFVWLGADFASGHARALRRRAARGGGVRFAGAVRDPGRWFEAADLVVVPSRTESFSRVALEAAALGRPVLAFAEARGPADLLGPENLVAPATAEAMAAAVEAILNDAAEARRRGAALRARVEAEFTAARWRDRLMQACES